MNNITARETMIDTQVRPSDVTDRRIHEALRQVPREAFLPKARHALAYAEIEHQVAEGRYLWRPRDFSKLVQMAEVQPVDEVLDIASGTGYSAAVLSHLAGVVVGLEEDDIQANFAGERLNKLEIANADVVSGDLKEGLPSQKPFDVIFVNGAVSQLPASWAEQLRDGGRLAVIVRKGGASQARVYVKAGTTLSIARKFDAAVPMLPGFETTETFSF